MSAPATEHRDAPGHRVTSGRRDASGSREASGVRGGPGRWLPVILAIVVGWTLVGLLSAVRPISGALNRGEAIDWRLSFWVPMISVWLWALFTPAVFRLSDRIGLTRRTWPGGLAVHLVAALALSALDVAVDLVLYPLLIAYAPGSFGTVFIAELFINMFSYAALVAVAHAWRYAQLYRELQLRSALLETQLAEARLDALRSHLHPHFLFNTINVATELIHEDPERADTVMTRLSALLRRAFTDAGRTEVPLEEELAFVREYLALAAVRFEDRLSFEVNAAASTTGALVPGFLIQPLVENAVRHGVEPVSRPVTVTVDAIRIGDVLQIRVTDTGPGMPPEPVPSGSGTGLKRLRAILGQLYPGRSELIIGPADPAGTSGTAVKLRLPFRTTAAEP